MRARSRADAKLAGAGRFARHRHHLDRDTALHALGRDDFGAGSGKTRFLPGANGE